MKKIGTVFYISLFISILFVLWGIIAPENLNRFSGKIFAFLTDTLGWFYLIVVFIFLIFLLYVAFSPMGQVKLGKDDEEPDFSFISWLAMLFSAGMGAGLLFWGVGEPVTHFSSPPYGTAGTAEAARQSLVITNFHWGLHAWAIYGVTSLALAYFGFRKDLPYLSGNTISHLFEPNKREILEKTVDIVSVIAVITGVAASLGMGVILISSGLQYLFNIPAEATLTKIVIIFVITVCFILSASTGLDKGIKILSNLNMGVAVLLLLFVITFGPTVFILKAFVTSISDYLQNIIGLSMRALPFDKEGSKWLGSWTLTYFTWWIAWAPFVGTFIARISKGRTIKEFVLSALFVPTLFSVLWFAAFGGTAINIEIFGGGNLSQIVKEDVSLALYTFFEHFPLSYVLSFTAILLITTFLVTSADSATFVIGMMTTQGDLNPSSKVKIIWGFIISVFTLALLLAGGLKAMQAASLTVAFPYSLVMVLQCVALYKGLKDEAIVRGEKNAK